MHLVRGIWAVKHAWEARGSNWKPKDFDLFLERMTAADAQLAIATEMTTKDPTAWTWRLKAAFAFQHPVSRALEIMDEVRRRAPQHRGAHSVMLKYLSWRWFGSVDAAFAFARAAVAGAPAGSNLAVLIPEVHLDVCTEQYQSKGKAAAKAYWKNPAVARELLDAHNKCFHTGSFKPTMDTPITRAYFAYTLWKSGEREAAAEHLRAMNVSTPYGPFEAPIMVFGETVKRARRECGVG